MGISLRKGPIWEPGGLSFTWTFWEKWKKHIWVPFLDPKDIKILSLFPSGILIKEQDCPELISDYGEQRTRLQDLGASGP